MSDVTDVSTSIPLGPDVFRSIKLNGADHAKRLEREADELEARAFEKRLEAFHTLNHARLASRQIGEAP